MAVCAPAVVIACNHATSRSGLTRRDDIGAVGAQPDNRMERAARCDMGGESISTASTIRPWSVNAVNVRQDIALKVCQLPISRRERIQRA